MDDHVGVQSRNGQYQGQHHQERKEKRIKVSSTASLAIRLPGSARSNPFPWSHGRGLFLSHCEQIEIECQTLFYVLFYVPEPFKSLSLKAERVYAGGLG